MLVHAIAEPHFTYYAKLALLALPVVLTYFAHRARAKGKEWRRAMREGGAALFHRNFDDAEDAFLEAVEIARTHRFLRESRVAQSLLAVSNVKVRLGGISEAHLCLTEALPLILKTHPPDDFNVALAHGLMADVRFDQGNFEDAERHFRAALVCDEARNDTGGILYTLQRLGRLMRIEDRFGEAESVYRRCIELELSLTQSAGAAKPSRTAVIEAFSEPDLLLAQERYGEAAAAFRRSIQQWERMDARPDNVDLGQMRCDLALALNRSGDRQGAVEAYRDAAAAIRQNWGSDHVRFASCLAQLSAVLAESGEHTESRRRAEESLAIWEETGLLTHPDALACRRLVNAAS